MPPKHLTELNMSVYLRFYETEICGKLFYDSLVPSIISQKMHVRWGEIISSQFSVSNGVNQGGVMSPVLFTVYLDNLLKIL